MLGNVTEWVEDWWVGDIHSFQEFVDPVAPRTEGQYWKVFKGGDHPDINVGSTIPAQRGAGNIRGKETLRGFRVVREPFQK